MQPFLLAADLHIDYFLVRIENQNEVKKELSGVRRMVVLVHLVDQTILAVEGKVHGE